MIWHKLTVQAVSLFAAAVAILCACKSGTQNVASPGSPPISAAQSWPGFFPFISMSAGERQLISLASYDASMKLAAETSNRVLSFLLAMLAEGAKTIDAERFDAEAVVTTHDETTCTGRCFSNQKLNALQREVDQRAHHRSLSQTTNWSSA
jgi:hypothetical protein